MTLAIGDDCVTDVALVEKRSSTGRPGYQSIVEALNLIGDDDFFGSLIGAEANCRSVPAVEAECRSFRFAGLEIF